MDEMPWFAAQRREAGWDARLARRPVCADCKQPVAEERYFPLEDGTALCPRCVQWRMVEVEE